MSSDVAEFSGEAMKMVDLCEEFMSTVKSNVPLSAREPEPVLMASERWMQLKGVGLRKRFTFRRSSDRLAFIGGLLTYEGNVKHHARMVVDEDTVTLTVATKNVDVPTELDREYARYSDLLYRDIAYKPDGFGGENAV